MTQPIVRVAVLAERRLTEMALPTELPLREILPAVQRLAVPSAVGDSSTDDEVGTLLSLAPIGGAPFSLDASLDTVGVVDGDLLALQPVPKGPPAPGIVEDIADAAVIFSAARRTPWGASHIQRGALAATIAAALAGTGLGATYRAVTGELSGLFTVGAIALLTAVAALVTTLGNAPRSTRAAFALSVAALAPIGAGLALMVPGAFGPAQAMLAAAGVTAWSVIVLMLPGAERERRAAVFTATAVVGAALTLAAAAATLWTFALATIGAAVIAAALLITIAAAPLSALAARLPLPVIPAPGDPAPPAPSLRVLEDLPRRVRVGDAHQSGFIAAAVLLTVLGSVAIALRPEAVAGAGWYVVAATSVASILRARVWDSAVCKGWLLAQPFLVAVVLVVIYAATGRYDAALVAVLVLAVLAVGWLVIALNPGIAAPESYSLPVRRLLGFTAAGLDASLIPVMAYLSGLFSWVLDR